MCRFHRPGDNGGIARDLGIGALMAVGPLERLLGAEAGAVLERFAQASDKIVATAVGQFIGTPLGTTSANFGLPGVYDTTNPVLTEYASGDQFGQAFDKYLNSPSVEDANQATPAAEPTDGGIPPGDANDNPSGGVPEGDSSTVDPADAGAGPPQTSPDFDTGTDSEP